MPTRLLLATACALAALALLPTTAVAGHVWEINGRALHWASTSNPARIDLGDNLDDSVWNSQRQIPGLVWSATRTGSGRMVPSPYLRLPLQQGGLGSNEVEMHDRFYGRTGWIGQATLNSVDSQGHIRDATVELNQSYSLSRDDKQATINHEVGHTLGLDHQGGTVMCPVLCGIENPTRHDYDVINFVNAHRDGYNTPSRQLRAPARPGRTTKRADGRKAIVYVTRLPDRTLRVRFRDFVSARAARTALNR